MAEKINIGGKVLRNEPMHLHTSFAIGGPADLFAVPQSSGDLAELVHFADEENLPIHVVGGGANILVADAGIRGLVISTEALESIAVEGTLITAEAGAPISKVAEKAAEAELSGLEFIYRMPGSTGGALWMNARCYGVSISERVERIEYIKNDGSTGRMEAPAPGTPPAGFAYKRSPFQGNENLIYRTAFRLREGDTREISRKMEEVYSDRREKGHFRYPSAGSVFKNDRAFGKPTGAILDGLGLKGKRAGNAQIADFHANIIVNLGGARAEDVRELVDMARREARRRVGIDLEPEIQFIGAWGDTA